MLYHVNTEDVDDECTWRYTLTFMYNSSSPINVCLMQLGRIVNPLLDTLNTMMWFVLTQQV
jgi:hypothetical protein